jgi:hypothetical protein
MGGVRVRHRQLAQLLHDVGFVSGVIPQHRPALLRQQDHDAVPAGGGPHDLQVPDLRGSRGGELLVPGLAAIDTARTCATRVRPTGFAQWIVAPLERFNGRPRAATAAGPGGTSAGSARCPPRTG